MLDGLLRHVAPHYCCSCDKVGALLCDNCKYDIISEPFWSCVACGVNAAGKNGICGKCKVAYMKAWCVSSRTESLKKLIDHYKFMNGRAAYKPLASLLDETLPELPAGTVIVPIPTVSSHIRQRGYDHMLLISKEFAKRRGLSLSMSLERRTATRQRDANAKTRHKQASEAFKWQKSGDPSAVYLLVDDVVTTGATLHYAAKTLRDAGVEHIWAASISRQPLD